MRDPRDVFSDIKKGAFNCLTPASDTITVHNLQSVKPKGDVVKANKTVLEPVAQIKGKGKAVALPVDVGQVINNVVKPFNGKSEIDRTRAT